MEAARIPKEAVISSFVEEVVGGDVAAGVVDGGETDIVKV